MEAISPGFCSSDSRDRLLGYIDKFLSEQETLK